MTPRKDNPTIENRVSHAMIIDDAYRVEQTLARSARGITELVTLNEAGPFVRKKIPRKLAHRVVWAALGDCGNAGLPRVQAMYETPDWFMVVHDYLPGKTLEAVIAEKERLSVTDAVALMGQLCDAVADLHAHGISHRDISPANVLVSEENAGLRAYLIDFGNAHLTTDPPSRDDAAQGTWGFAAPEQHGFTEADVRADIYSLGRLLGFMLTGARPGSSEDAAYAQRLSDPALVPPHVRAAINQACAFDRGARYQDVAQFARDVLGSESARSGTASRSATAAATAAQTATPSNFPAGSQTQRHNPPSSMPEIEGQEPFPQQASPSSARRSNRTLQLALVGVAALAVAFIGITTVVSALSPTPPRETEPTSAPTSQSSSNDEASSAQQNPGSDLLPQSGPQSAASSSQGPNELGIELVESGWTHADGGFVSIAFAVRNTNAEEIVDYPQVTVTGRAANGTVVFSEPFTISSIGPGETNYLGETIGNGTPPETVEFTLNKGSDFDLEPNSSERPTFKVSPVSEVGPAADGSITFAGEVEMSEGDIPDSANDLRITIVLRDESGAIICGQNTDIEIPEPGKPVPYSCTMPNPPEHASAEAHVRIFG